MSSLPSPARRLLSVLVAAAFVASLLTTARATAAPAAPEPSTRSADQATVFPVLPAAVEEGDTLVRLMGGAFDPVTEQPDLPAEVPAVDPATLPAGVPAYWLVQADGGDFAGATAAIAAAGAAEAGFVPDAAYLVRATPQQRERIAADPAVRAAVLYQPGSKVPVAAGDLKGLLDLPGEQSYRVYLFRTEPDLAAARAAVAAVPGVRVTEEADAVVDLVATAEQLPALAALTGVQWIEPVPTVVPLNAQAAWVNDTGVRDLFAATLPGRLNGAGQTAAVADTGINYTTDSDGNAQAFFRECANGPLDCQPADFVQKAAGNSTAAVTMTQPGGAPDAHRKMAAYFDIGNSGVEPADTSAHGTHVAGSVTGDRGVLGLRDGEDGMAPAARLVHQNIATPTGGLSTPSDAYQLWRQAYRPSNPADVPVGNVPADYDKYNPTQDARTHNNSYGLIVPAVSIGSAEGADRFVWDHEDMVIVASAGNAGPGPNTIGAPSLAKNVITSGASANGRQPMVSIDSMASFSSHGPTNGRFEVDFATPGQVVVSAKGGTSDEVQYLQGTSMSGPLLTGLATLVRQYFYDGYGPVRTDMSSSASGLAVGTRDSSRRHNPSAALVRATLADGAQRMRGFYTGDDGANRALDGQYPSAGQGFGLVNLEQSLYFDDEQGRSTRSHFFRDVYRADNDAFDVGAGTTTRSYEVDVAPGQPLSVSMAYTDAPTALPAGTSLTINNLDLVVRSPNGTVYAGNNFNTRALPTANEYESVPGAAFSDPVNPLERIRIANPLAGTWTIQVAARSVAVGRQGFALAASGNLTSKGGAPFVAGPPPQVDAPGAPQITDVAVEAIQADLAKVTWRTSEPTTGEVRATVNGAPVSYPDVYNLGRGTDGREAGYFGITEGPVETSQQFANRRMVQTTHEAYVTGLTGGQTYDLQIAASDLAETPNESTAPARLATPDGVYGAAPFDIAQLTEAPTDPVSSFDPILGIGDGAFGLGTQLYGGRSAGSGLLGAFMFRLPESVDPARIQGAAVEMTSAHDITNHYRDDVRVFVDLLDEAVEPAFETSNYTTIRQAPLKARLNAETGSRRGGGNAYSFSFGCQDLEALRQTLDVDADGSRNAAFRFDGLSSEDTSLFAMEFGFNRRSRGADLRPRLVLYLDDGTGAVTDPEACEADLPAPAISDVGVQLGIVDGTETVQPETDAVTVSWRTDVPSDSTVLYRPKGGTEFIQVGSDVDVMAHNVAITGLDPNTDYEFAVRSAVCNGRQTTEDNGGQAFDFFRPAATPIRTAQFFLHGTATDELNTQTGSSPLPLFDQLPVTAGGQPDRQDIQSVANLNVPFNSLGAFWTGDYTGAIDGDLVFDWFFSTPNAVGIESGVAVEVVVFADPVDDGTAQPTKIIGQTQVGLDVGPLPTRNTSVVPVSGVVGQTLQVQMDARFIDTGPALQANYDVTSAPSSFTIPLDPRPVLAPGELLPEFGPVPPPTANATGFNAASTPTRTTPNSADLAAGTARCAPVAPPDSFSGVPDSTQPPPTTGSPPGDPGPPSGSPPPADNPPPMPGPRPTQAPTDRDDTTTRLAGGERIATAIELSQEGFDQADAAILARADDFPDALAAATLAAEIDGPVLLTGSDVLDPGVSAELDRLGAETVYLAGGTAALSSAVEDGAQATGAEPRRVGGLDRFETAARIADEVVDLGGAVDQVIVARADDFPDALSASNLATTGRAPILLTATDDVPDVTMATLSALVPQGSVFVAGGTVAVDDGAFREIAEGGHDAVRLAGPTRFDTAQAILDEARNQGTELEPSIIANGYRFPDALAAGPAAHSLGGALLLVDPDDLTRSPATLALLEDEAETIDTVLVAGGTVAVSQRVEDQVLAAIRDS